MKKNFEADFLEFTKICKSLTFVKKESLIKKSKSMDDSKLDHPPMLRGQLIESVLINKMLKMNISKSIHNLEGRFSGYTDQYYFFTSRNHKLVKTKSDIAKNIEWQLFCDGYINNLFPKAVKFDSSEIYFMGSKYFKAKSRCFTKPVLEYCFIDLIIDNTIIDIKTDIHIKDLKKHINQVFTYAVIFSSTLKITRKYAEYFSRAEIEMINIPIENIAIYFWRTNEYYSYNIFELISKSKFQKLVNIYTNYSSHRTKLRSVMRKHLFIMSRPSFES